MVFSMATTTLVLTYGEPRYLMSSGGREWGGALVPRSVPRPATALKLTKSYDAVAYELGPAKVVVTPPTSVLT